MVESQPADALLVVVALGPAAPLVGESVLVFRLAERRAPARGLLDRQTVYQVGTNTLARGRQRSGAGGIPFPTS